MAIRFEYQPLVAGALTGYATGRGRSLQRQRKYNLELMRDQQRMFARHGGGLGARGRIANRMGQFGQQEAEQGEWSEDPFDAAVKAGNTQKARQIKALRKRGGSQDDPALYSQYTPGRTQKEIDRQLMLEDRERVNTERKREADIAFARANIDDVIPEIPDHLVRTPFEQELKKINDAERELRSGRKFYEGDEDALALMEKIRNDRENLMMMAPPPSEPGEELTKQARVWDAERGAFVQPTRGQKPDFLEIDGKLVPIPQTQEEMKAEQEREKSEEAQKEIQETEDAEKQEYFGNVQSYADELFKQQTHSEYVGKKKSEKQILIEAIKYANLMRSAGSAKGISEFSNGQPAVSMPTVQTEEEWEQLQPGTEYIGPDGKRRRKQ